MDPLNPNALQYSQLQQLLGFGQDLMNTPGAQGRTVGHTYVAASPVEHLSNLASKLLGGYEAGQARQGTSDLAQKILGQRKDYADQFDTALNGGSGGTLTAPTAPKDYTDTLGGVLSSDNGGGGMARPPDPGALSKLLLQGAASEDPGISKMGDLLMGQRKMALEEKRLQNESDYRNANLGLKAREVGSTTDANGNLVLFSKHGAQAGTATTTAPGGSAQPLAFDPAKLGIKPGALDKMAEKYTVEGVLPQGRWGKSSAAMNKAIANRADELYPDAHLSANRADYVGNMNSLRKMQASADNINAFEQTGLANLDNFLKTAHGVVDVGSPLFNKPLRSIEEGLAGSPQQAQFNAARQVAIQEISKVLGGAVAGGAVSDSQRHEVEGLMRGDATIPQLEAVASTLKQDMENRKNAVAGQIEQIRARTYGKAVATPVAAPAGKKKRWDPVAGKIVED